MSDKPDKPEKPEKAPKPEKAEKAPKPGPADKPTTPEKPEPVEDLVLLRIKNVIGPTSNGTAILLGSEEKTFVMFVGLYEGAAILRELNGEETPRPLTHELLDMILDGFNIAVNRIIISNIVDNTFCATLVLQQKVINEKQEWVGKRNEVRIDARPSDCIIMALKEKVDIHATRKVMDQVRDVSDELGDLKLGGLMGQSLAQGIMKLDPEAISREFEQAMQGLEPETPGEGAEPGKDEDVGLEFPDLPEPPDLDIDEPDAPPGEKK